MSSDDQTQQSSAHSREPNAALLSINQVLSDREETIETDEVEFVGQQSARQVEEDSSDDESMGIYTTREIADILLKDESDRTPKEIKILDYWSFAIPDAEELIRRTAQEMVADEEAEDDTNIGRRKSRSRNIEKEEQLQNIENKADVLAILIKEAKHAVIYTGAGVSTSASIPDYRGPNGVSKKIGKITGTYLITQSRVTSAKPTFTHMAIRELCKRRMIKHVVSQNPDGLHLRSGLPQKKLSEIHGNMYIEVCSNCEQQYIRQADVTERTARSRHLTGRKCHACDEPENNLIDTIKMYGDRHVIKNYLPVNWKRAGKAVKKADLIICMGSTLKSILKYPCLWPDQINKKDTKLVIVNLQRTPMDKNAVLKIRGRCDHVMQLVMQRLNIKVRPYKWSKDPLRRIATPFTQSEIEGMERRSIFESTRDDQPAPVEECDSNGQSADELDGHQSPIECLVDLTNE